MVQNPSLNVFEEIYTKVKVHFQGQKGRQCLPLKAEEGFFRRCTHKKTIKEKNSDTIMLSLKLLFSERCCKQRLNNSKAREKYNRSK